MAPPAPESASPIGIANLPNQRHKIVAKRGAGFTIMVSVFVKNAASVVRVIG
jgi:cell division control protein 12